MKNRKINCLPLEVCRNVFSHLSHDRDSMANFLNGKEMRVLVEGKYSDTEKNQMMKLYSERINIPLYRIRKISDFTSDELTIIDNYSLVMMWSENKQILSFDKDFLHELIRTENVQISKNAWDFLPYEVFYLNFGRIPPLLSEAKVGDECRFLLKLLIIRKMYAIIDT